MTGTTPFDPTRHLTKVSGRDYLEVKWRVVWLRDTHPEAVIETDMVQHQNQMAVFRARVECDHHITLSDGSIVTRRAVATGWGSEGSDDFEDYLEKAETKALGRALAALGFGTQFCPDYDFGSGGGERSQAADTRRSAARPASPDGTAPVGGTRSGDVATPRQVKYLWAVVREKGIDQDAVLDYVASRYGTNVDTMSRRDISAFIESIQAGSVKFPARG